MKTYREQIIDTINELWEARIKVFGLLVSMAMSNDYKELDEAFEIGEVFKFHYAHFEDLDDVNIQKMISLCKSMDETINSLLNLNGIDKEEVDIDC
ncbi:hypothetical protein Belba_0592 [Belliella baltica DSM 15883]|uniref:Uncharacterized protein n=1 Tax=Belliella baltica (strain DSM 15883 / CIP 108006 / LMG 21964 / BA134) TaxID=866536 RepID=I3Z1Y1_BELBD|nr:hypothetical protein [Belliella baltica]AFL83249.1 hypothetical protein Belba_0592 [Belliella baltica DSM 15883]